VRQHHDAAAGEPRPHADDRLEVGLAVDRAALRARARSASDASPADPGRRSGNAEPSCSSESRSRSLPYARAGSNASAIARVRSGDGRPSSENATTNSASTAGRKAAL
jgi:hypothetical protein